MEVEITLEPIESLCPLCSELLVALPGASGTVAGCFKCGGAWLDNVAASWIVTHSPTEPLTAFANALAQKGTDHASASVDEVAGGYRAPGQSNANCPTCREELRPVRLTRPAMVVELCDPHGTFFRGDELRQLTEEARRNISAAELAELQAEVEAVADAATREYEGQPRSTNVHAAAIFAHHYRARGS